MDDTTGEVVSSVAERPDLDEIATLKAELADANRTIIGQETDLKAWRIRYRKLAEDKAAEARESYLWPVIAMVYVGYQKRCNKRAAFTTDRFWAAEPFFRTTLYGKTLEDRVRVIATAIAGAQHDPYRKRRKNGTWNTFDGWGNNIFVSTDRFDEFVQRAPVDFEPVLSPRLLDAIQVAEGRAKGIAQARRAQA